MFNQGLIEFCCFSCYLFGMSSQSEAAKKIPKHNKQLGKNIQKIRKSKQLTQEELAEKVGKSRQMITFVETGRERPNLKLLEKIAKALGVKVKDLIPY